VHVKDFDPSGLQIEDSAGTGVVVGIDVAKKSMKAALVDTDGGLLGTVKWEHPCETKLFREMLGKLGGPVEVAAEPTGTYGEALMGSLRTAGHPVFMVGTKRSHDAAEVFDGVPSKHDSKDGYVVARLHLNRCSRPWSPATDAQRDLKAWLRRFDAVQERFQQGLNRLEALLARYWPGVTVVLPLDRVSLWALLERLEWSGGVASEPELARRIIRAVGRGSLRPDAVEGVLQSARSAEGVRPTHVESEELRELIGLLRKDKQALEQARQCVKDSGAKQESVQQLAPLLGSVTAAALFVDVGDPREYHSSGALLKAMGLNLKERSSGKYKGQLKLTKRGPSRTRKYLYFAALRMIQKDPVVRAWYDRKLQRDGGRVKNRAVIAVMRKLVRAAYHVARGESFDARKLFDVRRLKLAKSEDNEAKVAA